MNKTDSLGTRLKRLRKDRKLAQADVAAAVNISRSHLAEIESGKNPGFATFVELADFFAVSLDYLYFGRTDTVNNVANSGVDLEEDILIRFWRGLDETQRRLLLDLLVHRNSAPNVA